MNFENLMKDSLEVDHTETIKFKNLKNKTTIIFKNIFSSNLSKLFI